MAFVNPVLISDDFEIIAGHGRVEAAKMLGLKQVPTVRLSNLSPAGRRAYIIADNRLAELAGWDRELLATEVQGLLELQFDDIELTGFSLGEVDLMLETRFCLSEASWPLLGSRDLMEYADKLGIDFLAKQRQALGRGICE